MADITHDELMEWDKRVREVLSQYKELEKFQSAPATNSGSGSIISINAGGAAVWAAVTACLCTTLLTVMAVMWAMFQFADIRAQSRADLADIRDTEKLHKAYIDKIRQDQKEQAK